MEPQEVLHNQQRILVQQNMEMLVELLVLMVLVVVEQAVLVNHMLTDQAYRDGVELECKHQQHSEILMQDMVDLSLEEIHLEMIGDLLVVVEVVVKQILLVLMVVLILQVEEYQVDHTMVQEVVHKIHQHQQKHQHQHLQIRGQVAAVATMEEISVAVTAVPASFSSHILPN